MQEERETYKFGAMELKDRLKQARKNARLSQVELAERVGIKQASISEIERGLTRTSGYLIQISKALDVDPLWLSEGVGESSTFRARPIIESNAQLIGAMSAWGPEDPIEDDEVEIPYYAQVEFSGGGGMTEVVEVAGRKLRFSKETLRAAGVTADDAACARVNGRSMERLILDGATIGFDKGCTSIIDGEIYAFNQDGMLRVKYLYRVPGGGIRVRSENSDEFPDEMLTAAEFRRDVIMLGRVFWWSTVRRAPRR